MYKKYKQLRFENLVKIETLIKEDFKLTEIAIKLSKDNWSYGLLF